MISFEITLLLLTLLEIKLLLFILLTNIFSHSTFSDKTFNKFAELDSITLLIKFSVVIDSANISFVIILLLLIFVEVSSVVNKLKTVISFEINDSVVKFEIRIFVPI